MPDKEFAEEVWFVYGIKVFSFFVGYMKYQNKGTVCSVEFDLEKAFFGAGNLLRKIFVRDKNKCDPWLLGFYHTHPAGHTNLSSTDFRTMSGWVKAMGRPLICGIICEDKQRCYTFRRLYSDCPIVIHIPIPSVVIKNKIVFGKLI